MCCQVWGKKVSDLKELLKLERRADAVECLNELVTCAIMNVPDVLLYLSRLQNESVFHFWAVHQLCYTLANLANSLKLKDDSEFIHSITSHF